MSASGQRDASARLLIDSSGIVVFRPKGDVDEEAMIEFLAVIRRGAEPTGSALILCDLSDARSVGPAARGLVLDALRDVRMEAVAIVGASFHMRVLVILVAKAFRVVTGSTHPVVFFDAEAEGYAWLLEQRRARAGVR